MPEVVVDRASETGYTFPPSIPGAEPRRRSLPTRRFPLTLGAPLEEEGVSR
jgi:hypothetical protein